MVTEGHQRPHQEEAMSKKPTASGEAAAAPKVSDSEIRLARAVARSMKRDHEAPDEFVLAIAALPLPEDKQGAA